MQTRIHTAALTIPGVLLAAVLADPGQGAWRFALFGATALTAHAGGFLVNGLFDLDPWDRNDPSKGHFPLVNGTVTIRDTWFLTLLVSFASFALGAGLANGSWAAIAWLFSFTLFGTLYNYFCKISFIGPLLISASFASLPLYAWFASGGAWDNTIAYITGFSFLLMIGQIACSGWVKELAQPGEVNYLRVLGARAAATSRPGFYEYHFPVVVKVLAVVVRVAPLVAALWVGRHLPYYVSSVLGFLVVAGVFFMLLVVKSGHIERSQKVRQMGVAEILAYWALIVSLSGALGPAWTIGLIFLPLAWYLAWNLIFWGKATAPAV